MVVKSQRTPTKVIHVVLANKLRIELTKFLCKNFGNTKSYKDTKIFIDSNHIAHEKAKILNEKIDELNALITDCDGRVVLEASYPYFVIEYERSRLMNLLGDLVSQISFGESIYPSSVFLLNKKLDHVQNSIDIAETIINEFEFCVHAFSSKDADLSKFDWYLDLLDQLVDSLKDWRSRTNKFREICIHSDLEITNKVKFSIEQGIMAHNSSGDLRNVKEYNREVRIARGDLIVDENGKAVKPKKPQKAVIFTEPFHIEPKPIKLPAPGFNELPKPAVIFEETSVKEKTFHPKFTSKYVLSA